MTCEHSESTRYCDDPSCDRWGRGEGETGQVKFELLTNTDPMSRLPGQELDRSTLRPCFKGELPDLPDKELAERVFHLFNVDHRPNRYDTPSMSVGDVVVFIRNGSRSAWLCEPVGFTVID